MTISLESIREARRGWSDDEVQAAFDSRQECSLCPSFVDDPNTGYVKVRDRVGEKPTKLLLVGEAPGAEESREGYAFVGPAAKHAEKLLSASRVDLDQCRWANVVCCFPHDDSIKPRPPTHDEILPCFPYLVRTIAEVNPEVIMTFGTVATKMLLGDGIGTMAQMAGKIFKAKLHGTEYTVVPCYHPSADLRSDGRFTSGIMSAASLAWGLIDRTEIPITAHVINSTSEAINYLADLLQRFRDGEITEVAYDLEWSSQMGAIGSKDEAGRSGDIALYNPEVTLSAVSFATSIEEGYTIILDHAESEVDVPAVQAMMAKVLTEVPVIVHGAQKAEIPWTRERLGVIPTVTHDTMLMSYAVWMRQARHSLKGLCGRLFGWPDWSADTDAWFNSQTDPLKRTFRHLPLNLMARYAPVDACGTWGAKEVLDKRIDEFGVRSNYERRMALMRVIVDWEERGNHVDMEMFARLKETYPGKVDAALADIRKIPEVAEYEAETGAPFNPRSHIQLGDLLYGKCGAAIGEMNPKIKTVWNAPQAEVIFPIDIKVGEQEILGYQVEFGRTKKVWVGKLSGEKGAERMEIKDSTAFGVTFKAPFKYDHDSPVTVIRGNPKTDEEQLMRIEREAWCPTCGGKGVKNDEPCPLCEGSAYREGQESLGSLAEKVHLYKKVRLIVSNYLEKFPLHMVPGTNRVIANYLLHSVATGRLSTKDMNIHSFPWNSDIRRLFVSKWYDKGGLYMGADYSQLEVRVLAAISKDPILIEAYLTCKKCSRVGSPSDLGRCPTCKCKLGIDLHRMTAASVFNKREADVTGQERTVAKSVTFGVIYGRGAKAIADETGLSKEESEKIIRGFFNKYEGVKEYVSMQHKICDAYGCSMSETGSLLYFDNRDMVLQALEAKKKVSGEYAMGRKPERIPDYLAMKLEEAHRQSQNFPVQGAAGEMTLDAIITLDRILTDREMQSHAWETTHDSIGMDLYPESGEILTTMNLVKEVMEDRVSDMHPWMTVPLVADRVLGARWDGDVEVISVEGDQIEIEGPTEYYEQIIGQLNKAGLVAGTDEEKLEDAKPAPEVTKKGYQGGSGRVDMVHAVIRLVV